MYLDDRFIEIDHVLPSRRNRMIISFKDGVIEVMDSERSVLLLIKMTHQ